jgi:pimeloyl-ACP methyl ester carboxylesterase
MRILTYIFTFLLGTMPLAYAMEDAIKKHAEEAQKSDYFKSAIKSDESKVGEALRKEGFKDTTFNSPDGLTLNGLLLKRANARYTVIFCAGWFPGKKEGMASFYKTFPQDCNVLLFDARGHGKSQGSMWGDMWSYGLNEYKDIIGAIEAMHQEDDKPIIIHGVCAGAFNAAHALIELQKQNRINELKVKGLIFDSGWISVSQTARCVVIAKVNEFFAKKLSSLFGGAHYKTVMQNPLFGLISIPSTLLISVLYGVFFYYPLMRNEPKTNLLLKMEKTPLQVPTLFIHSDDDECVDHKQVKKLADCLPNKTCWWITKPSKHVCHHLKHTHDYVASIHTFLRKSLR